MFLTAVTLSVIGHVVNWLNSRSLREEVKVIKDNVEKVEIATNSMKDKLIEVTATSSHAEGVLQGRADQKAENKLKG